MFLGCKFDDKLLFDENIHHRYNSALATIFEVIPDLYHTIILNPYITSEILKLKIEPKLTYSCQVIYYNNKQIELLFQLYMRLAKMALQINEKTSSIALSAVLGCKHIGYTIKLAQLLYFYDTLKKMVITPFVIKYCYKICSLL